LAPHALFTASTELYRRCQQIASAEGFLLTTHLAESREEMQMFRDAAGPLFEFLRDLGRGESDDGRTTPLARFLKIRDSSLRSPPYDRESAWIIAHLNELTESDFQLLGQLRQKFSIAHCPRSHAYFQHSPFACERLSRLGFNVCLATDSLASNADLSLFAEMREFQQSDDHIRPDQILHMATVNPARALGRARALGKIAPGFLADMIALPISGSADVYEQIIAFSGAVPWMMVGGEVR